MAIYDPTQNVAQARAARAVPIGWTYRLAARFPRTNQAKLVVMPHPKQGMPVRRRNSHSASPKPRWVPTPSRFGGIREAVIMTERQPAAITKDNNRLHRLARLVRLEI